MVAVLKRNPAPFLAALRSAHPDMVDLFRKGQCYSLFLVVRTIWPQAQALYSAIEGHVYFEIDGKTYDIGGRAYRLPDDLAPLEHKRGDPPHRWGGRDRRRLVDPRPQIMEA